MSDETNTDTKTLARLARLETRAMKAEERIKALEAAQHPTPINAEYTPGWRFDSNVELHIGIADAKEELPDVYFEASPKRTSLWVETEDDSITLPMDKERLKRLISAAMTVLNHMESDNAPK